MRSAFWWSLPIRQPAQQITFCPSYFVSFASVARVSTLPPLPPLLLLSPRMPRKLDEPAPREEVMAES